MNILIFRKIFSIRKNLKISIIIFSIFVPITFQKQLLSDIKSIKSDLEKPTIKWKKINIENQYKQKIIWEKIEDNKENLFPIKEVKKNQDLSTTNASFLSSLNRSIVFSDRIVGPDISWLVPPGFKWNDKYKFDFSTRGHSKRKSGDEFLGWNGGDAVSQNYFQFINKEKYSFGINFGIRSVYSGSAPGGSSSIGEGQSLGFRWDYALSENSGLAIGAEQLIHFDGLTDTGRDLYLTMSKGFRTNSNENFPFTVATVGIATGKMAEGNVKGLCSNLFGGSGTEIKYQRKLCWAPVFSISRVHNKKLSTFFEYNSKWFLLGSSISPFYELPLRGTFAVQLSDHIDNYKLNNFEELKWVFRLSLGF